MLAIEIENLIEKNATDFEISKLIKNKIKEYYKSLDDLSIKSSGKDFLVKHTKKIDSFIEVSYKYIIRKNFGNYLPMSNSIPITLVALGSYGREQLCLYSDIDLMIVYKELNGFNTENIIREFLTFIWDTGLKLGHRVHEVGDVFDASTEDFTIKTALIESRLIFGSKMLWFETQRELNRVRKYNKKEFIANKIEEHNQRLLKNPLSMQLDIKDGYGGLREANLLFWISNTIYGINNVKALVPYIISDDEYREYRVSLEFIFRVRIALHLISKRKNEKIFLENIPDIAKKLEIEATATLSSERQFIQKLFLSLHTIHRFSKIFISKISRKIYFNHNNIPILRGNRVKRGLFIKDEVVYTSFYRKDINLNSLILELLEINKIVKFDRSYIYFVSRVNIPTDFSSLLKSRIYRIFAHQNQYAIIKLLFDANILHKIIPPFRHILNLAQFDGYHTLPVDMHTVDSMKHLNMINDDKVKSLYDSLLPKERQLLSFVLFFHDIGKGRATEHHILGAKIFKDYALYLGLDKLLIDIGFLLIELHTLMSHIANREDINNEKVLLHFAGQIKTEKNLKMLYVLTYADINGVSNKAYSGFMSSLLRSLYDNTVVALSNKKLLTESSKRVAKERAIKNLNRFKDLDLKLQKKIFDIESNLIFLNKKAQDLVDISKEAFMVKNYFYKIERGEHLIIKIIRNKELNLGYLLGKLSFLNILSMNIYKLFDNKKYFEIIFSESIDSTDIDFIESIIEDSFDMNLQLKLKKPNISESDLTIDCSHSKDLSMLKIDTKDQKALFAYVAKVFDDLNIEIESAKIFTHKNRVRDLILVEKNGNFCSNSDLIVDLLTN